MRTKCYQGGNKHKFEPRYDEKDKPGNIKAEDWSGDSMENIRKLYILRVYIKDICVWCGKEIQR